MISIVKENKKIDIIKYSLYDGPIFLAYYPDDTIISINGIYLIYNSAKYFKIDRVYYEGKEYDSIEFFDKHNEFVGL